MIKDHYTLMEYIVGFAPLLVPIILGLIMVPTFYYLEDNSYKHPILKIFKLGLQAVSCVAFVIVILMFIV